MVGFDFVTKKVLGIDSCFFGEISSNVGRLVEIYYKTNKFIECEVARETSRRLNRRNQKLEKHKVFLTKTLIKRTSELEKYKIINIKQNDKFKEQEIQISFLVKTITELNNLVKKRTCSLNKWMVLSRFLFTHRFHGVIVNINNDCEFVTMWVKEQSNKFVMSEIAIGTEINCIQHVGEYILIDFIKNDKFCKAYISPTNICLAKKK